MKISVIGLGKLGLPLAATIASVGFKVIGVDLNHQVVKNLNAGRTTLLEPNLVELITEFKHNIIATEDAKDAVLNSEITFIITPTPSQKNGYFSLKYVNPVIKQIGNAIKNKDQYHLVVVVSTIMPGSMDIIKKDLEKFSEKTCGLDFGLCYNPEFIALGSVIQNLLNPDFILIGESDQKSGAKLERFYKAYTNNKPPIARMNFINAELSKIAVNTYITTKISYANMLAEICEKLPGGDVDAVTEAIGLDTRIGRKYLQGGPPFGGPCFPRDNLAFISLARKLHATVGIPQATHVTNLRQTKRLAEKVLDYWKPNMKVGILGVSYKPFTDVIDESAGLLLAKYLIDKNILLNLYDPLALDNAEKILGEKAKYIDDLEKCIADSDILVITTNWPHFKDVNIEWFDDQSKTIIDTWRMLDQEKLPDNVTYIPLGSNL